MTLPSPSLQQWQRAFLSAYMADPRPKTLLYARPGAGKASLALALAAKMLESNLCDSFLLIGDEHPLRNQWLDLAPMFGLQMVNDAWQTPLGGGAAELFPRILSMLGGPTLDYLASDRRWLIVADGRAGLSRLVDHFLGANADSRVLSISTTVPTTRIAADKIRFDSEQFYEHTVLELPSTRALLELHSPSLRILRDIHRGQLFPHELSWREFEKLIARLLAEEQYEVELMRGTKDGGVDVIATKSLGVHGHFRALWQAKKYSPNNKVGISAIRELADTRDELGASKGVIVTSSYLTRGALNRVTRDRYQLAKVDRDDLAAWLARLGDA